MSETQYGFIGTGRMALALARGFVHAGLTRGDRIWGADPSQEALDRFSSETGAHVARDNHRVAEQAEVLFLAVKPQQMQAALEELKGRLTPRHLVISIAAGVPLGTIAGVLGPGPRLVRVMPNTPCLVGKGACGYALGQGITPQDADLVRRLLNSVGTSVEVSEKLLDAVTGLSGSGPAFVFLMIEALSDGGVRMGLPREAAAALAAQTVLGAAELVLQTGEHPAVLRDQVASPGGTTIAGLQVLEREGVRGALMAAVEAAAERSAELGRGKS